MINAELMRILKRHAPDDKIVVWDPTTEIAFDIDILTTYPPRDLVIVLKKKGDDGCTTSGSTT